MNIIFQEFQPTPLLANIVESYWYLKGEGSSSEFSPLQRCLPIGATELIIHLNESRSECFINGQWVPFPEAMVVGVKEKPIFWRMPGGNAFFGVRFTPEAFIQLFKIPVSELLNSYIDATLFLGKDKSSIITNLQAAADNSSRIFLIEAFIQTQLMNQQFPINNCFLQAADLIRKAQPGMSIDQLSKAVYISERQLQRVFKEHLGMGPKNYLRIVRFQKAYQFLQSNPGTSMSGIACDFGFSDQAHFIRDFKEFSGMTPSDVFIN